MREFRYVRPADVDDAVAAVAGTPGACFLAGGTNLVDLMKLGVAQPEVLVDVSRLPLDTIEALPGGGLRIGATVRNSDLAADRTVRRDYPVLSQALLAGASGQLRNAATVGGNLMQRTRCRYFTDTGKPCNKRAPGSGCAARDGRHRDLAVLGASADCVAVHPSDMAVALAALDAVIQVRGSAGARRIPLADLYPLPGSEPDRDTVLARDELITGVELPPLPAARRSRYRKVRDRASFAFALVSVAVAIELQAEVITEVRIAYGGLAPRPWRAARAETVLRGGPATEEQFSRAADAELADADPLPGNAFKVRLASAILARTLADAVAVAGNGRKS